nr:hypothetical protein [Tanacetum cinerariifolium]
MADDEVPTNMALMALSDSKVQNRKTCSNTYLKSYETLKTQYDNLRIEFNKFEFDLATYKRGIASIEEQLGFYKKNDVEFCDQIYVLKRDASFRDSEIIALNLQIEKLKKEKERYQIKIDNFKNAYKSLDKLIGSQINDNSKTGLGFISYNAVAPLPTDTSNEIKKALDALIINDYVSDSDEDESKEMVLKSDNVQHKPEQANQPRKIGIKSQGYSEPDTKDSIGAGQSSMKTGSTQDYIIMPLWKYGLPLIDSSPKISGDAEKKHDEVLDKENKASNELNSFFENVNTNYPDDPKMPRLETITTYDDSEKEADFTNLIEEEVHACQPLGFEDPDHPDKVYKVVKSLYGLHQALRAWYETLAKYLLGNGFHRGEIDQTLFIKRHKGDFFLVQKEDGIFISQDKYVDEVLRKFNFSDVKSASTPVDMEKTLVKDADGDDVDVHLYIFMIGSLMYLTTSRPDIIDSLFELVTYTDSDYVGASLDMKFTTRGCQFLGSRLISWQCKKQTMVATSITKSEYVAVASLCG